MICCTYKLAYTYVVSYNVYTNHLIFLFKQYSSIIKYTQVTVIQLSIFIVEFFSKSIVVIRKEMFRVVKIRVELINTSAFSTIFAILSA